MKYYMTATRDHRKKSLKCYRELQRFTTEVIIIQQFYITLHQVYLVKFFNATNIQLLLQNVIEHIEHHCNWR